MSSVRHESIDTPRGRMAWREAGEGWPVVLLHGFPFHAAMWQPQLEMVPPGWRFIAPDLRGFGGGPPLDRDITVDEYARDIAALMDALEIERAGIGGLSMGGYITFALFRQAPARFTAMLLADTRPQADTPAGLDARRQLRQVVSRDGAAGVATAMLPKLLADGAAPDAIQTVRGLIESADPRAIDAAIGALMHRPDSSADLSRINVPTLVVVGAEDALTPVADSEAMQRAISRSTLVVIPGAGHMSNLEQPAAFSRALADFLGSAL